jgi:hypothetical protein
MTMPLPLPLPAGEAGAAPEEAAAAAWTLHPADGLARLPGPPTAVYPEGARSVVMLSHGSLELRLFHPASATASNHIRATRCTWSWPAKRSSLEPVDDPRDPEGHRAPGHHLAGRRPAVGRHLPGRGHAEACARVLRDKAREALQYAASEGFGPLREWVAAQLPARRACDVQPAGADHHRLAAGAGPGRQGADRPRQPVAVESPTYLGALQAFTPTSPSSWPWTATTRARCREAWRPRAGARFAYLLPNFQNPSGRCLSEAAAPGAGGAARRAGLPLVEDNPYGDLWFDAPPPPPLAARWAEGASTWARSPRCWRPGCAWATWWRRRRCTPSCCRPSRRPTCTRPGFNQRLVHEVIKRRLPRPPRAHHPRALQGAARRHAAALERHLPAGLPLAACRPAACSSGSSCPPGWTPRRCCRGGGRRHRLRARRAVLCRSPPAHAAPELRHRVARAASKPAWPRWPACSPKPCGIRRPSARPRREAPLRPARRLHRRAAARQPAGRGARRRGPGRRTMAAFARWTNLSETTFLLPPDRPGGRLPRAHLHARRRAALCRPPDAGQLPRLAGRRRACRARRRGGAAVRRGPGAHPPRRHSGWPSPRRRCAAAGRWTRPCCAASPRRWAWRVRHAATTSGSTTAPAGAR